MSSPIYSVTSQRKIHYEGSTVVSHPARSGRFLGRWRLVFFIVGAAVSYGKRPVYHLPRWSPFWMSHNLLPGMIYAGLFAASKASMIHLQIPHPVSLRTTRKENHVGDQTEMTCCWESIWPIVRQFIGTWLAFTSPALNRENSLLSIWTHLGYMIIYVNWSIQNRYRLSWCHTIAASGNLSSAGAMVNSPPTNCLAVSIKDTYVGQCPHTVAMPIT